MKTEKIVQEALKVNPEMQLVLDIAARARATEAQAAPAELRASTDVVAIPSKSQCAV
ncbi:MAG TPA: hypothetical protein VKR59_10955 [Terriglobales bacterium]|nr:hypothetical protein [Terriglobales bacterium]